MITSTNAASKPLVITLFGPLVVQVKGHPLPRLRSRKSLWLLALLALRGGRPVDRDWLGGTLWPDAVDAAALLRPALSELRGALGESGTEEAWLTSPNRRTLCLSRDNAEVDVRDFDDAIADGTLPALERAAALYSGPLLEGCSEEWVFAERTAREVSCLRALEKLTDAALTGGNWQAAAHHAQRALALDPWRDRMRRALMEALSKDGDINAALHGYRQFAAMLRDDRRAAPDEQTTALYERLRAEARRPAPKPLRAAQAATETEPAVRGSLPRPLTDLIGREEEREEVAAQLRRSRLVTLTGPGGIGKTRLALAVAEEMTAEFTDGVWMVPLEAVSEGDRLPEQIAAKLGLKEASGQSLQDVLQNYLRERQALLLLDNCEHLLEATVQVVRSLLRECAGIRILATSRELLRITGETVWSVPTLSVPDPAHLPPGRAALVKVLEGFDGVQLFVERARTVEKTFTLNRENARTVAAICARLEGMPLALELAAARMRVMTAAQMADRLRDHLGMLTAGSRAALPRQQTMRATLDWSYALLSVPEQLLLARLSVFSGGWTLEAAEAVCAGDGIAASQILELLMGLVDKSLAAFSPQDALSPIESGGRYRLLEAVRQYATERLPKADGLRARHRDWCLVLAEQAEPHFQGAAQADWLNRLGTEHDNLRAALDWEGMGEDPAKDAEANLRLAGALSLFWFVRAHLSEGYKYLSQALNQEAIPKGAAPAARIKALTGLGRIAYSRGDYAEARDRFEESLTLSRQGGNRRETAAALKYLGDVAEMWCEFPRARALYEESLGLFREIEDRHGAAQALCGLAHAYESQGDPAAEPLFRDGLQIFEALGDTRYIAWVLTSLGSLSRRRGDYSRARENFERSLRLYRELGDRQGATIQLGNLGNVAYDEGDYDTAQIRYEELNRFFRELGSQKLFAWSL
ncbi:MAG: tetratricopeptide repeat protein, partial [Armatimonadota bacterium]